MVKSVKVESIRVKKKYGRDRGVKSVRRLEEAWERLE